MNSLHIWSITIAAACCSGCFDPSALKTGSGDEAASEVADESGTARNQNSGTIGHQISPTERDDFIYRPSAAALQSPMP